MNLFERVKLGSRNLNLMKKEVCEGIKILQGFLKTFSVPDNWDNGDTFTFARLDGEGEWKMTWENESFLFYFWSNAGGRHLAYSSDAIHLFRSEDIFMVWDSMDALYKDMVTKFPFLNERFAPLLQAAGFDVEK